MNGVLFKEFVKDALRSIQRAKMRSALTLLGVVFGIAAVITMMGIGEGAQKTVLEEISGMGLQNIIVYSIKPATVDKGTEAAGGLLLNYGLKKTDVAQIAASLPEVDLCEAMVVDQQPIFRGRKFESKTLGVPERYFSLMNGEVRRGRGIAAADDFGKNPVAVLNPLAASIVAGQGSPVGELIKVGVHYYKVVGVVEVPAQDAEPYIYIPHATAMSRYGQVVIKKDAGQFSVSKVEVGQLIVHVPMGGDIRAVASVVMRILDRNHINNDYAMTVPLKLLESRQRTQQVLNLVLVTIAAISLLVGGIGIMNIMLANVTERIPEIGIRIAVGATKQDIMMQFLAETMTLSLAGGVIGCLLGLGLVPIASHFMGWDGVVTLTSVVVSLCVSVAVGLIFGTAPAMRAARLDPGVALKSE